MKKLFWPLLFLSLEAYSQTIVFIGDSLTEGHQLSKEEAYPALIEKELRKKHPEIKVINGGVSGATSASGPKRLEWYLKTRPDIIVLALGANDGLRGLKASETEKNLEKVIERARTQGIKVVLAGMKMPTNYGETYRKEFESVFPRLAKKHKLKLVPFLLENVGGKPELNLPDGIHPNAKGYEVVARTVLKALESEL